MTKYSESFQSFQRQTDDAQACDAAPRAIRAPPGVLLFLRRDGGIGVRRKQMWLA
jgi:hypothetical protein